MTKTILTVFFLRHGVVHSGMMSVIFALAMQDMRHFLQLSFIFDV